MRTKQIRPSLENTYIYNNARARDISVDRTSGDDCTNKSIPRNIPAFFQTSSSSLFALSCCTSGRLVRSDIDTLAAILMAATCRVILFFNDSMLMHVVATLGGFAFYNYRVYCIIDRCRKGKLPNDPRGFGLNREIETRGACCYDYYTNLSR